MNWFIGHLIGDYLLQNDWMAMRKKESTWVCSIHCSIWALCVVFATHVRGGEHWPWWTVPICFALHFVQDRTLIVVRFMMLKGSRNFLQAPMAPWSIIVTDNAMHLVALWALSQFI